MGFQLNSFGYLSRRSCGHLLVPAIRQYMLDCFENEQVHHDQLRSQGADVKIKKRLYLVERWSRSRRKKAQGSGRLNFQYCRCGSQCLHRSMHAALFLLFVLAVRSSGADEFAEDREAFEISGKRSLSVANATNTSSPKAGPIAAYLFCTCTFPRRLWRCRCFSYLLPAQLYLISV